MFENPSTDEIAGILRSSRTIAVVGASSKPDRASYRVAEYLKTRGYRILPVNPNEKTILGEPCWASLEAIPDPIDVVCVFRKPEEVGPIADAAVKLRARVLWLQDGVVNEAAASAAKAGGLAVVMDRCMFRDHLALVGSA